jgi:hypothetical protein
MVYIYIKVGYTRTYKTASAAKSLVRRADNTTYHSTLRAQFLSNEAEIWQGCHL